MLRVSCLLVGSLCLIASSAGAQDSPRYICEPHFWRASLDFASSAFDLRRKKSAWLICSEEITSKAEAESRGINLKLPIEGIPIEAMFSEDQATREEAHRKICDLGFEDVEDISVQDIVSSQVDPRVNEAYNECVSTVLASQQQGGKMLSCNLSAGASPLDVIAEVIYHPTVQKPNPTATSAQITGGFIRARDFSDGEIRAMAEAADINVAIEDLLNPSKIEHFEGLESLGVSTDGVGGFQKARTTLPIEGKEVTIGSHLFNVVRSDQFGSVSITVKADDGLACTDTIDADKLINVHVEIMPKGNFLEPTSKVLPHQHTKGCDNGSDPHAITFCVDPEVALLDYKTHIISQNCGSAVQSVSRMADAPQCVEAKYILKGCGKTWYNCKGRGWVDFQVELLGERAGQVAPLPKYEERISYPSLRSAIFDYPNPIPDDITVETWDYTVTLDVLTWDDSKKVHIPQSIALSPALLEVEDFSVAGVPGADGRSFKLLLQGPRVPESDKERREKALAQGVGADANYARPELIKDLDQSYQLINPGAGGWLDRNGVGSVFEFSNEAKLDQLQNALQAGELSLNANGQ